MPFQSPRVQARWISPEPDLPLRRYFEGESVVLPQFYHDMIRKDLGPMWVWLPEGALAHDPYVYLRSHSPSSLSW
jgi:hypothetical protein